MAKIVKEYESLIEDLHDLVIIAERKDESSKPLSVVKEKLLINCHDF